MWHPMDLETLKATKIGKTVNEFKKNAHPKAAQYAREVVNKWKKLMTPPAAAPAAPAHVADDGHISA